MLRTSKSPVSIEFSRKGGSRIFGQLDIWRPSPEGWVFVESLEFRKLKTKAEDISLKIPKGTYTCMFQCFVQESLNGRYEFTLNVDGAVVFADSGDVDKTSAKDDAKAFKDQFVLEVK